MISQTEKKNANWTLLTVKSVKSYLLLLIKKEKKKETLFSEHTDLALNKSLCFYNQTEKKTMKHFEL